MGLMLPPSITSLFTLLRIRRGRIPLPERAYFVLVADDVDRRWIEREVRSIGRIELQRDGCEHAREVAVGKDQHRSLSAVETLEYAAGASRDFVDRFAAGERPAPDCPA